MNDFPGIGHVAVTVTDLAVSRPWYQELIGAEPVVGERDPDGIALVAVLGPRPQHGVS